MQNVIWTIFDTQFFKDFRIFFQCNIKWVMFDKKFGASYFSWLFKKSGSQPQLQWPQVFPVMPFGNFAQH